MEARKRMQKSFDFLSEQLTGFRLSISPALIESIRVRYYGQMVPIKHLALVSDTKQGITVTPFDKTCAAETLQSITGSGFQAYYITKGVIIVNRGQQSAEDNEKIRRQVSRLIEDAKVAIRNIRREVRREIDSLPKDESRKSTDNLESMTSEFISKIDQILSRD